MNEFLTHYREILTDPAHLAVEVTLMVLVDFIFLGAVLPFIKRAVRKHDREVHGKGDDISADDAAYFEQSLSLTRDPAEVLGPIDLDQFRTNRNPNKEN